jgi:hypothetical protein
VTTKACNAGIIDYRRGIRLGRGLRHGAGHGSGERARGKGNVVVARGVAGTGSDTTGTSASLAELKKYPDIKGVATINPDDSPDTTTLAIGRSWRVSARSTTAEDYSKLQMDSPHHSPPARHSRCAIARSSVAMT